MTDKQTKECSLCEDSFMGEGFCPECGLFDCCYYTFCKLDDRMNEIIIDFAKDMQGNPRLTSKP